MRIPELRFRGFDKQWEEKKVSNLLTERKELDVKSDQYPLMAFIANSGIVEKGQRYDRSALITDEENKLYKKTCKGDFIYSSNNLESGSIGLNLFGNAVISPVYSIFKCTNLTDSNYIGAYLTRDSFIKEMIRWRQGVMYGQWRIHENDFLNIAVHTPSHPEQQKLGFFFTNIDTLIKRHSMKLDSLKQIKSACLQSMFPQKGESVPKVRFHGFEGKWKTEKLINFVSRITRKNKNLESRLPLTISAADGLVSQLLYFNNIVAGSNLSGYYLIKKGEFAYNKSYSNGYPFGSVKRLDKYDMGVLSTLYIVFGLNTKTSLIDSDYLATFFSTKLWHHEVAERAEEGARNHGLLNIGAEDFLDINIIYPQKLSEQQKISAYFALLEQKIDLQKQCLEKLKHIKIACLEKMFV